MANDSTGGRFERPLRLVPPRTHLQVIAAAAALGPPLRQKRLDRNAPPLKTRLADRAPLFFFICIHQPRNPSTLLDLLISAFVRVIFHLFLLSSAFYLLLSPAFTMDNPTAYEVVREAKYRHDAQKCLERTGRQLSRTAFNACNSMTNIRTFAFTEEFRRMQTNGDDSSTNDDTTNHYDPGADITMPSNADTTTIHHKFDDFTDDFVADFDEGSSANDDATTVHNQLQDGGAYYQDDGAYYQDDGVYHQDDGAYYQDDSDIESLAGSDDFSTKMIMEDDQSRQPRRRRYPYSYSADDDRRWREYERGNPHAFSAPLPPGHPLLGRRLFGSTSSSGSERIKDPYDDLDGTTLFKKKLKPRPWWELYRDPEFYPETVWVVPPEDLRPRKDNNPASAVQEPEPLSTDAQPLLPTSQTYEPSSPTRQGRRPSNPTQQELGPPFAQKEHRPPSRAQQPTPPIEPDLRPLTARDREWLKIREGLTPSAEEIELFGPQPAPTFAADVAERTKLLKERGLLDEKPAPGQARPRLLKERGLPDEKPALEQAQPSTPPNEEFNWDLTNSPELPLASTPVHTPSPMERALLDSTTPQGSGYPISVTYSRNDPATAERYEQLMKSLDEDPRTKFINEQAKRIRTRVLRENNSPPTPPFKDGTPNEMGDTLRALSILLNKQAQRNKSQEQQSRSQGPNEDRQQEINQLRSMSTRLHAASRSIKDAYNNAKQLVNSVDLAGSTQCTPCQHCGHANQSPIGMILTGIKRLFFSTDEDGRTVITWFGLVFFLLAFWYFLEVMISKWFETTAYSDTMTGYGVFPDRPRYPFAILSFLFMIPPVNWMLTFFQQNFAYEVTKTIMTG